MVDWLTLVFIIIIAIALIIANIYLLAYYCHPDDKGTLMGIITKVIVVLGLTLSWAQVLMVPLDVSNNRSFGGGINMQLFWYIIFIASVIYILLIFPITTGLYESDPDSTCCDKFKSFICCFICVLFVIAALALILFFTVGDSQIPIRSITCTLSSSSLTSSATPFEAVSDCTSSNEKIKLEVSFIIYMIAVMSFISYFVFAIFGGIGLAAVPLDFFRDFCSRPKRLKGSEIKIRKEDLFRDIEELKELGEQVKEMENKGYHKKFIFTKQRRQYNRLNNQFKAGTMLAEQEYEILNIADEMKKHNSCVLICYYMLIPLGIISLIISLLWVIQFICSFIYMKNDLRPGYPFISFMFIFFQDHDVGFLSFFFFAVFCLYLLLCTLKGNLKFGLRLFCCMSVHPMKKDETYMNSFLFNVTLVLLGSISITHCCAKAFSDYVVFTDIDIIFNVYLRYLDFFSWFYRYNIFEYIFLGIFVISLVVLIIKKKEQVTPETLYTKNKKKNNNDSGSTLKNSNDISKAEDKELKPLK